MEVLCEYKQHHLCGDIFWLCKKGSCLINAAVMVAFIKIKPQTVLK